MTSSGVRIEQDNDVLRVILDRPEARNAQTPATWRAMASIPSAISDEIRLVVIQGEGPSFSAGLDRRMLEPGGIKGETSIPQLASESDAVIEDFIAQAQQGFTWTQRVSVPVVAYVQGHAIGAGFQLALAADMIVVAPDAQFAMRETSLGLVPDLGGTGPLVAAVGYSRAFEICVTGRFVDAQEAVELGFALTALEQQHWPAHEAALVKGLRQLRLGAVGDLKALLRSAVDSDAQLGRERQAQIRRLRDLASDR